jgi:hypothetical protein
MHENSLIGMSYVHKDIKIIIMHGLHSEWQILRIETYGAKALDFKLLFEKIKLLLIFLSSFLFKECDIDIKANERNRL